jgi:predicted transcriptional regulator
MEALWRKTPLTAEQIIAVVGGANGWAPGTVRTLITRLLKKKAIAGAREGDAYCYRPLIARSAWVQAESQGLLDRLFKGEVAPLVAHFAENRQLSAKDVKQLKALIAKIEENEK